MGNIQKYSLMSIENSEEGLEEQKGTKHVENNQ